jgi:RNA polymerase sigma-54 factor
VQRHNNNRIDALLLGKIVLARFLEMPLRTFDKFVRQVESSPGFVDVLNYVTPSRLDAAEVNSFPDHPSGLLGDIQERGGKLRLFYRHHSFVREYLFDEEFVVQGGLPKDQAAILSKLRLINTRNRLTQALMQALLAAQTEYLRSGNSLSLVPLTQSHISTKLISEANLSVVADPGRISRLVRNLSIRLPNGQVSQVAQFFPKPRHIHCHFVANVVEKEKLLIASRELASPLPDEAIAAMLERDHGIRVSRRTVANIRHDLAIPDSRCRSHRTHYWAATAGFSVLLPLTFHTLRQEVPIHSGVYEIRSSADLGYSEQGIWRERCISPRPYVIYIGSAGDLRKRLSDHLRGNSSNDLLHRHIADGAAQLRFRMIRENWRSAERDLYQVFCETFGGPPLCNRMSP